MKTLLRSHRTWLSCTYAWAFVILVSCFGTANLAAQVPTQREVFRYISFDSKTMQVHLSASGDSLFVITVAPSFPSYVQCTVYNTTTGAVLNAWTFRNSGELYCDVPTRTVLLRDGAKELHVLRLDDGVTKAVIGSTRQVALTTTRCMIRWSLTDTVERISLDDLTQREFLDVVYPANTSLSSVNGDVPTFKQVSTKLAVTKYGRFVIDNWTSTGMWLRQPRGKGFLYLNPVTFDTLYIDDANAMTMSSRDGRLLHRLEIEVVTPPYQARLHTIDTQGKLTFPPIVVAGKFTQVGEPSQGWLCLGSKVDSSTAHLPLERHLGLNAPVLGATHVIGAAHSSTDAAVAMRIRDNYFCVKTLAGDVLFEIGTDGPATSVMPRLIQGRYLLNCETNPTSVDTARLASVIDLHGNKSNEFTPTRTSISDYASLTLHQPASDARTVNMYNVIDGSHRGDVVVGRPFKLSVSPERGPGVLHLRKLICDTLGTLWYHERGNADLLWVKGPADTSFTQQMRAVSQVILPTSGAYAYALTSGGYQKTIIGRLNRHTGRVEATLNDLLRLPVIISVRYNEAGNTLVVCTPTSIHVIDPVTERILSTRDVPNIVYLSNIAYVNPTSTHVILTESATTTTTSVGRWVTPTQIVRIVGVPPSACFMYDGAAFVERSPDLQSMYLRSTVSREYIDLGTGTCTDALTFDHDSSVVLCGPDSVIVLRDPLHLRSTLTSVSQHSGASHPRAVNGSYATMAVDHGKDAILEAPGVAPHVPCEISVGDFAGRAVILQTVVPDHDSERFVLQTSTLPVGAYTVRVVQAGQLRATGLLLIH
jgi:hypothetical protein